MIKNNVNYNLQIKVRRYLEYLFNEERQGDNKGEAILQTLSKSLKDEIMLDVYGKITTNIQILNRNFSKRFLMTLALKFKEVSYAPEEIIFKQNQEESHLYFVKKGDVEIFLEFSNEKMKQLSIVKPMETFGHFSFITGCPSEYSARSLNVCRLISISKSDFHDVLEKFPKDMEKFFYLRDSFMLYQDYEKIGLRCFLCNLSTHTIFTCPSVHLPINREVVIRRHLYSDQQKRKKFRKRTPLKFKSFIVRKEVENAAIKIRLKIFARNARRAKNSEENQNYDIGTNSDRSLSMIDSLTEEEEEEKEVVSETHLQLEEDNPEQRGTNFPLSPSSSWNPNSCSQEMKFRGNATCRHVASENPQWKNERSHRAGSVLTKSKRVSIAFNEKSEKELSNKKPSVISQSINIMAPLNTFKKEGRLFMMDLDSMKIFSCYFPHNNINKILKQTWYGVGRLGYGRSLTNKKTPIILWRRKKPTRKKKLVTSPFKHSRSRMNEKKAVTFF